MKTRRAGLTDLDRQQSVNHCACTNFFFQGCGFAVIFCESVYDTSKFRSWIRNKSFRIHNTELVPLILSVFFQLFPLGPRFRKEIKCGSGSTALTVTRRINPRRQFKSILKIAFRYLRPWFSPNAWPASKWMLNYDHQRGLNKFQGDLQQLLLLVLNATTIRTQELLGHFI